MTSRKPAARAKAGLEAAVAAAAFRLLASRPWRQVTMSAVARAAKCPLADVLVVFPSRSDLIAILLRQTGREAALRYRPERGRQSARERLFDVVMTWFEVQTPRKKAIRNLVQDLAKDPLTLLSLRTSIVRLSEMLLALAEADASRYSPVRAATLAVIVARAIPIWLEDDGEDGTMAQVDRDLARLQRFL